MTSGDRAVDIQDQRTGGGHAGHPSGSRRPHLNDLSPRHPGGLAPLGHPLPGHVHRPEPMREDDFKRDLLNLMAADPRNDLIKFLTERVTDLTAGTGQATTRPETRGIN